MSYDKDNYLNTENDDDLWDDELELSDTYTPRSPDTEYERVSPIDDQDQSDSYSEHDYEDESHSPVEEEPHDYYSESDSDAEPAADVKPKREGFFKKRNEEEDDNDYFDSDDEPAPVKKPKLPKLDPEDPDYWIEEESPLDGIIHKPGNLWKWWLGGAITLLVILIFCWVWFFRPYVDNAVKYGYVINMERRGSVMKTFEGTMIPYKELGDPNPLHFEKVKFSVENDSLAAVMKRMMLGCVPMRVEYKMYRAPLLWKGEEKMIIIKADTADLRKIYPPEYR